MTSLEPAATTNGLEIALVAMSGRFPGASTVEQFWRNLCDGIEALTHFADEELAAAGVPAELLGDSRYVKSNAIVDDIELFDAEFFGYTPLEADVLDPQQRLFLECAWEALERAGYDGERFDGAIGVYAGISISLYMLNNLYRNQRIRSLFSEYQIAIGNEKDFLATRVSYKLNLKGPAVTLQTACSTSLVAVHMACQSLLSGECDLALAGGVAIRLPQTNGYLYQEGGIASPDGHCRAFDASAQGTISGNGVGVVVLKRLADAIADGDAIYAVIKGSAINNDGADKTGYTAPSEAGQARVIRAAQLMAEVEPETISFIEGHGTGTPLGDPIEVAALSRAFRERTGKRGFCAIGSVKTNIGHLDSAAGVAGLIKTALALQHRQIPPSLHFEQPNPAIDFTSSPFYVNNKLREWSGEQPRRAAVSSFGIGGTNAHVILEEAPAATPGGASRPYQLLALSAKSATALEAMSANLASHLRAQSQLDLADVAHTLHVGRRVFNERRFTVCQELAQAIDTLERRDAQQVFSAHQEQTDQAAIFMFPGGGAQYVDMGLELYQHEAIFREHIERCCALLLPQLGFDLRTLLYPAEAQREEAAAKLKRTALALPALFTLEYALAMLWSSWRVTPEAMIGHSLGEYVAACLAGVFSLEDALALVVVRSRLFEQLPPGAMTAVPFSEEQARALAGEQLCVAAVNSPANCVLSGSVEQIAAVEALLEQQGVEFQRIRIEVAAHSAQLEPILEPFGAFVSTLKLSPPRIPYLSNVSGTWITAEEATSPSYWVRHLRQTVRFADGMQTLLEQTSAVCLEVGPGRSLSTLVKLQAQGAQRTVLPSMRHPHDQVADLAFLLTTLGKLWLSGVAIDWAAFYAGQRRRRVCLPTYPFERQRHWIEAEQPLFASQHEAQGKQPLPAWFYAPSWVQSCPPVPAPAERPCRWLVFMDQSGLGAALSQALTAQGHTVIAVQQDEHFAKLDQHTYAINPRDGSHYQDLLHAISNEEPAPEKIVHLWNVSQDAQPELDDQLFLGWQHDGFYSLMFLAQALHKSYCAGPMELTVVGTGLYDLSGLEPLAPYKAPLLSACKVIQQEMPTLACRCIDIALAPHGSWQNLQLVEQLLAELAGEVRDSTVALRGVNRWIQRFTQVRLPAPTQATTRLRQHGVYLITGGLGRVGLSIAEELAGAFQAKLVLVSRASFPEREAWDGWLEQHDAEERTSARIRALLALEALGAEVVVHTADVADEAQLRGALARAEQQFGSLQGVIHAAGFTGLESFSALHEGNLEICAGHFRPKAHGVLALGRALRGRQLDFCLLCSSLSTLVGGLGFAPYAAANSFLDAFSHWQSQREPTPWISVNWEGWDFRPAHERAAEPSLHMTREEGIEAFRWIMSAPARAQIVVSSSDLQARIAQWIDPQRLSARAAAQAAPTLHSRPAITSEYLAPGNDLERTIAEVWQQSLGIEQIGIHDNFFELGGHSLMATQLMSRLRETLKTDLPLRAIFEGPTVAQLAQIVGQQSAASKPLGRVQPIARGGQSLDTLLDKLKVLSADELQALLSTASSQEVSE